MLIPFLSFNGYCREAMLFYQYCLGGELHLENLEDVTGSHVFPKQMSRLILQATLSHRHFALMGSDIPVQNINSCNSNTLVWYSNNKKEMKQLYTRLATGAKTMAPLAMNYWGDITATLTDKYNLNWLLYCPASIDFVFNQEKTFDHF